MNVFQNYVKSKEYNNSTTLKEQRAARKKKEELYDNFDHWKAITAASRKRLELFEQSGCDTACDCEFSDSETEEFYKKNKPSRDTTMKSHLPHSIVRYL